MTDRQPDALRLADHNADLIQRLRRTPMPLADLIPHLQAMGDELRRLHAENEKFKAANITLMERIDRRDARIAALEQAGRMAQETLQAEIERLNKAVTYEQHRAERIGTHGPGCEMWGPQHYECSSRRLKEQQDAMARVLKARDRYGWSVEADVEIEAMRQTLGDDA